MVWGGEEMEKGGEMKEKERNLTIKPVALWILTAKHDTN